MKLLLLFDQNLSHKLVNRLNDIYPEASHVRLEDLDKATDEEVWKFARNKGFTIVSQDSDFLDLGLLNGAPPKIIWIRCGNTSTNYIESILRNNHDVIKEFVLKLPEVCLELV